MNIQMSEDSALTTYTDVSLNTRKEQSVKVTLIGDFNFKLLIFNQLSLCLIDTMWVHDKKAVFQSVSLWKEANLTPLNQH